MRKTLRVQIIQTPVIYTDYPIENKNILENEPKYI